MTRLTGEHLWVIGPGRLGRALAALLAEAGARVVLLGRDESLPAALPAGVLLTVPDHAIRGVAQQLASHPFPRSTSVLHMSGAVELETLNPLADRGCSIGGLHPLVAVPNPIDGVRLLRNAWWGVEGEGPALALASRIVASADGRTLRIPPGGRALYHAAAVLASNYLIALLSVAEGVMARGGIPAEQGRDALANLASSALTAVRDTGPVDALTGPVVRGDVETVRAHLARLSAAERDVYCALGREALGLARQRGLDEGAAAALQTLLGGSA